MRHEVVSALSALEANDPKEEVVVCRSELSEECSWPRVQVTHSCSSVSITSALGMRTFRVNGASSISYSSRLNRL